MMCGRIWRVLGLVVLGGCSSSGGATVVEPAPEPAARIALAAAGDSVVYVERTGAFTLVERPGGTLDVRSSRTAVIHVVRTAPDTLEAFYEHLLLRFEIPTETRNVDTRALIGPRFVLRDDGGRIETVSAPELSGDIRQLADLRRQFEDFFLRLPDGPLAPGVEWVDTLRQVSTEGEGSTERLIVTRFRVRGDTVADGIAARVVDYEAAVDASTRSAPSTQGTLVSSLVGGEEGTFLYSPERRVMLRRHRVGALEGELVIQGNLDEQRFAQSYVYESTIELLPPLPPGGAARPAPAPRPMPIP